MNNSVTHMAAVTAAMRMLLAGDRIVKPSVLLIAASTALTKSLIEMMMFHAAAKRSTFLAIFRDEDGTALLDTIVIVDASTKKGEISICGGKFIRKADGSFAIRSNNSDDAYEYRFANSGRRLIRRAAYGRGDRAVMELNGLRALLAKAATPECQEEAAQLSVHPC